jgi:hypothetical protein
MEREQRAQVAPEALALAEEIRRRHGAAVSAILFYGSCLRKQYVDGGVLDFYTIVDSYRAAYSSKLLALSNALLPPNVYYVELPWKGHALRMKYNIISRADFSAACRPESSNPIVWARFCQPSAVVYARDWDTRSLVAADAAEAVVTMVSRMLALFPQAVTVEYLWQAGFRATYTTELRAETPETIRSIYESEPARYDKVAALAVEVLVRRGLVQGRVDDGSVQVRMAEPAREAIVAAWKRKLRPAKALYVVRLLKSAATFGDWFPYAIWKLTRHSGVAIEVSDRQRRHPFVYGWPLLWRILRDRTLR